MRDFIELNVAVADLEQELQRTLQPHVKAPHTGGFDNDAIVQIPQRHIFQPRHQKSSADGMRL